MHTGKKSRTAMDKPDPPAQQLNGPTGVGMGRTDRGSNIFLVISAVGVAAAVAATVCIPTYYLLQDVRSLVITLEQKQNENYGEGPKDCYDISLLGHGQSGVYKVYPQGSKQGFDVFCEMEDGGGWVVIQRRMDGSVDFAKKWSEYQIGFGDLHGEFWIGNELLHKISTQGWYEMQIDMEDFDGEKRYAAYKVFQVEGRGVNYRLTAEAYHGNAGDSLAAHNGMPFSTIDHDNDLSPGSCAKTFTGGWWFSNCLTSNANGEYLIGQQESVGRGVLWDSWRKLDYSLKNMQMKIRPL